MSDSQENYAVERSLVLRLELRFLEKKKEEAEEFLEKNPNTVAKDDVELLIHKLNLLIYRYKSVIKDLENVKKEQ